MALVQRPNFEKHCLKAMRERYFTKSFRLLSLESYGFDFKSVLKEDNVDRKCGGARVLMPP